MERSDLSLWYLHFNKSQTRVYRAGERPDTSVPHKSPVIPTVRSRAQRREKWRNLLSVFSCHPEGGAFCRLKDLGELREASRLLRRNTRAFSSHPYSPPSPPLHSPAPRCTKDAAREGGPRPRRGPFWFCPPVTNARPVTAIRSVSKQVFPCRGPLRPSSIHFSRHTRVPTTLSLRHRPLRDRTSKIPNR